MLPCVHPEPTNRTASRSVQPFCTSHGRLFLSMPGHVLSPKNCPLCMGNQELPSNAYFPRSIQVHNPNGISIGSAVFEQLTAVLSGMPGHALSPKNCPFAWGTWTPSNTYFLGPIRVHNPNGISISLAVHAQLMADSPYTLQWASLPSKNCPFPRGIWTPI